MSTVNMMYDNTTSRLVEVISEALHYIEMASTKANYINSSITSTVNLIDQWIEREPELKERWQNDRNYLQAVVNELQSKVDRMTSTNLDTIMSLTGEEIKVGGTD